MLSVRDVLALPVVRTAEPAVLAGGDHLDRVVRWVHTTELADIGPLLRGGDLVLTTGIALPDTAEALARFAGSLADSGAVGLVVELGRRWSEVPPSLVAHCDEIGLPLVALRREARFAAITQTVGERLVDAQVTALRQAEQVHDTFTELTVAEAGPGEVLAAVQQLSGAGVVLEDEQHRVLDYRPGPGEDQGFLDDWERRSRRAARDERTYWDEASGWLVTRLGRPDRGWGRLVIAAPTRPSQRLVAVAERGAATLAMHRLHDRTRDSAVRRRHHELLTAVLTAPTDVGLAGRLELAGLPPDGRTLVGLALRPGGTSPAGVDLPVQLDELVAGVLRAAETVRAPVLVAAFESDVRALVAVPGRREPGRLVETLVGGLARGPGDRPAARAAAGSPATTVPAAARSLREAGHVLSAVGERPAPASGVHRLADAHLRGLLALLVDDERVATYTERELGPLRAADETTGSDLLRTTRALVEHGGSKSAAADALNVSRPALYERLRRIERLLGADLADAEVRTSLHVALLADEALRLHGGGGDAAAAARS